MKNCIVSSTLVLLGFDKTVLVLMTADHMWESSDCIEGDMYTERKKEINIMALLLFLPEIAHLV